MKNEKNQNSTEKRSVNDFEHKIKVTLTPQHYIDYAVSHSEDQIKKGKQRAILWAVLFVILGGIALFKSTTTSGRVSDVYLAAGILMICFQVFNLFYNFVMFKIALKHSIVKELKKDPSLLEPMEYAFEPEKIVCFLHGKHRSTVLTKNISGIEESNGTIIIEVVNGKRIIIPMEAYNQADDVVKTQIQSFKK